MTDTTEQQAVTVAQEDREFAAQWIVIAPQNQRTIRAGEWDHHHGVQAAARHRLVSESSASAEDAHSDDRAVDLFAARMKTKLAMAREKGRGGWDDPAQCSISHLRQLLHEHVAKGDPVDVANFCMMLCHYDASTSPEPVPATNQAGEVAVEALAQFLHDEGGFSDAMTDRTWPEHDADTGQRENGWVKIVPSDVVAKFRDVARRWLLPCARQSSSTFANPSTFGKPTFGLDDAATQPATSQEGEAVDEAKRDAWSEFFDEHLSDGNDGYRTEAIITACRTAFDAAWPKGWEAAFAAAFVALPNDAATPTPPTLSEDLRAAIEQALQCTPFIRDSGLGHMEIDYDCGDPWEILRAALARAQVKAS